MFNRQFNIIILLSLFTAGMIAGAEPLNQDATILFWVDRYNNAIVKSDIDGNNRQIIMMDVNNSAGVSVDHANGNVYWIRSVQFGGKSVNRARLDGSGYEIIVNSGMDDPKRIAVDGESGFIFWTDNGHKKIFRANLDGSNILEFDVELSIAHAFGIDRINKMLYWSHSSNIERMAYDGSNREIFLTSDDGLWFPGGLDIDAAGERLYLIDVGIHTGNSFIYSVNLDGTEMETVLSDIPRSTALDIAVDPANNHIYYTSSATSPRGVYRVDSNGTGNGIFANIGAGNSVTNMVYDSDNESLYWLQQGRDGLFKVNSSSREVEYALPRSYVPNHIVVDNNAGMIYWSTTDRRIIRASTNGGNSEEIVSKQDYLNIHDLALSSQENKLYFSYEGFSDYRIGSVDLDSRENDDIFQSNTIIPYALHIDDGNGYIYWSDRLRTNIHRSNTDGTGQETILTNQDLVITEIKLDAEEEKLYWVSAAGHIIKRSNIDGSEVEILHENLSNPRSLSIDAINGYLYFADENGAYRSSLDGSDPVTIVGGLWVGAIETGSGFLPTNVVVSDHETGVPEHFELYQNYPNPFNPSTTIRYTLPEQSNVRLEVFNMIGQRVSILVDSVQEAGTYSATWHSELASGMYFYRLEAISISSGENSFVGVNSMMLLR